MLISRDFVCATFYVDYVAVRATHARARVDAYAFSYDADRCRLRRFILRFSMIADAYFTLLLMLPLLAAHAL